jgi:hypothetical protein
VTGRDGEVAEDSNDPASGAISIWHDQFSTTVQVGERQNHSSISLIEVLDQAICILPRDANMGLMSVNSGMELCFGKTGKIMGSKSCWKQRRLDRLP